MDERARNELYNVLTTQLGDGPTSTLMSYLPTVGWADVATKDDLRGEVALLRGELAEARGEVAELKGDVVALRTDVDALRLDLASFKQEVRAEFVAVRAEMATLGAELRTEMAALETRLTNAMRLQLFAIIGAVATMQGITIAVLNGG